MSDYIKTWLKGLAAAAINGAATAAAAVAIRPDVFLQDIMALAKLAFVGGLMGVLLYLKQSPLPSEPKVKEGEIK